MNYREVRLPNGEWAYVYIYDYAIEVRRRADHRLLFRIDNAFLEALHADRQFLPGLLELLPPKENADVDRHSTGAAGTDRTPTGSAAALGFLRRRS